MIEQIARILLSTLIWTALLAPMGYLLAIAGNLLDARRIASRAWMISPVLGFSVAPILLYLCARFLSMPAAMAIAGSASVAGMVLLLTRARELWRCLGRHRNLVLLAGAWVVLCVAMMLTHSVDQKLYVPVPWLDYTKHNALTDAITRTGVPPASPFLYPGHSVPTFYYYGWFILSSVVDQIGGRAMDAHDAVMGGIVFTGIATMGALLLLAGVALPGGFARLRVRAPTIVLLLCVTGLDAIPTLAWNLFCWVRGRHDYAATVERWNEQISGWLDMLLWVPQHCGGAVAGCMAIVLLRYSVDERRTFSWIPCIVAGASLASCACMSVYLAMGFAVALGMWALFALLRGWRGEVLQLAIIGAIAAVLALPFALELNAARYPELSAMGVAVRKFTPVHLVLRSRGLDHTPTEQLAFLLTLPVNYFIELGFFLLAGWVFVRRSRSGDRPFAMLASVVIVSLVLGTFVRSSIRMNDFGWRVMIPAQMVLLIWASVVLEGIRAARATVHRFWRITLYATLVIGVFSTVLDLILLRISPYVDERVGSREALLPAEYGYWSRDVYAWIDRHLPQDAVIQYNPAKDRFPFDFVFQRRQVAVASEYFGTLLGIPSRIYEPMRAEMLDVFNDVENAGQGREILRRYKVDALIVTRGDVAWNNPGHWLWNLPLLYENPMFRVVKAPAVDSHFPQ